MDLRDRMPRLAIPLAVVGAAAGWLSAELLDNPLSGFPAGHAGGLAAAVTAASGALVGLVLQRACAPRGQPWVDDRWAWLVPLVLVVPLGGAVSGAVVGGLAIGNRYAVAGNAILGVVAGVAFLPVCALVVAAARRAARARRGSLVASADRRELWAIMAAALSVTTALAIPDWLVGTRPIAALAMAGVALFATLALLVADGLALVAVGRAARDVRVMEARVSHGREADGAVPVVDLGLGEEVHAHVVRSASAYRGHGRAAALLVGSVREARAAVRLALSKKVAAALVAAGAIAAHVLAAHPVERVVYYTAMCHRGSRLACGIASAMLRERGPKDMPRAAALGAAASSDASSDATARLPAEYLQYTKACYAGESDPCRDSAALVHRELDAPWMIAALFQRACEAGDANACTEAVRARESAQRAQD